MFLHFYNLHLLELVQRHKADQCHHQLKELV